MKQTCSRRLGRSARCVEYLDLSVDVSRPSSKFRVTVTARKPAAYPARRQSTLERGYTMTDARSEWISKRAYTIWEEAGRPHGLDAVHWEQAVQERDEFERVALVAEPKPAGTKKPLIEISKKAEAKKPEAAKSKKKADAAAEKPVAAKAVTKAKSTKAAANSKLI